MLHSLQDTLNGINFYLQVLMLIWKAVLAQWLLCNQLFHLPNQVQDDKTQLHNAVYQIICDAHSDPLLQDLISSFDPEVLLACPTKYIKKWIKNSRNNIQVQQAAKLHMQDILHLLSCASQTNSS